MGRGRAALLPRGEEAVNTKQLSLLYAGCHPFCQPIRRVNYYHLHHYYGMTLADSCPV